MALNDTGTFRRGADTEEEDRQQTFSSMRNESWKSWPNKAGFEDLVEHRGPMELHVKGTIPAFAAGTLYRNGPGDCKVENTSRGTHNISHWFDGIARFMAFEIRPTADGKATVFFSSRNQSEKAMESIRSKGWNTSITFAQRADPCIGIFAKFMTVFEPLKNVNSVDIILNLEGASTLRSEPKMVKQNGVKNIFLTQDSATLLETDPDTLEPVGYAKQSVLHPDLKGSLSCAHAQRDPETGDWFNFNLKFGRTPTYRVFRTNAATGKTDILATFKDSTTSPAYIHSFFLTRNYVVLCIPVSHFGWGGMKIPWKLNMIDAMKPFDDSKPCKWIVVDRRHNKGVISRFETPASFFFHSVNAFEEGVVTDLGTKGSSICLDLIMYDSTEVMFSFYYDILLNRNNAGSQFWQQKHREENVLPRLVRYQFTLPPSEKPPSTTWATAEEVFSIPGPHVGELPTINPSYACKPYRYIYSVPSRGLSSVTDSIAKTDVQTREALIWAGPHGHSPGEPVFVERPGATEEDDGVVLSLVLDGNAEKSYLLCLDARTMEEMGRAEADFAIGMGFHGVHARAMI